MAGITTLYVGLGMVLLYYLFDGVIVFLFHIAFIIGWFIRYKDPTEEKLHVKTLYFIVSYGFILLTPCVVLFIIIAWPFVVIIDLLIIGFVNENYTREDFVQPQKVTVSKFQVLNEKFVEK